MSEAAAQDIRQGLVNLIIRRLRSAIDESFRRQDDAAQTETALRGLLVYECLLNRMRFVRGAQPFERGDIAAGDGLDRRDARPDRLAFDDHRAGAALSEPTAELGTVQGQLVRQHIEK